MMDAGEGDFTRKAVENLGTMLIDVLAGISGSKSAQRTRDAAQVAFVALGNLDAMKGRTDMRPLLYHLSDRTGGKHRT